MLQGPDQPVARPQRHLARVIVTAVVAISCAIAGLALMMRAPLLTTPVAQAKTVGRGIIDQRLEQAVTDLNAMPAWYAFIGGNTITATPSESAVAAGAEFTVSGVLTTKEGPGADVPVLLQTRGLAGGTWSTVATPTTTTDAAYSFAVTPTTGSQYRVIWDGV